MNKKLIRGCYDLTALTVGIVSEVEVASVKKKSLDLRPGQGIIVQCSAVVVLQKTSSSSSSDDDELLLIFGRDDDGGINVRPEI